MVPATDDEGADVGLDGLEDKVFDAVLFDMDGTLVDSTAAVYRAWARWAVRSATTGAARTRCLRSVCPHRWPRCPRHLR